MTWDRPLAFLSRCHRSIYDFDLKPDVNGLFCTVLTQDPMFMQSTQSSKSAFSEGRERAHNPEPVSTCKLQTLFLQVKLHAKLSCLSYPDGSKAFFLPYLVMRSCMDHGARQRAGIWEPVFCLCLCNSSVIWPCPAALTYSCFSQATWLKLVCLV